MSSRNDRNVFGHVTFGSVAVAAILFATLAPACSTVAKANKTIDSARKAADNVSALTKNLNETLTALKAQAKTATTTSPLSAAKLPALPAKATGAVDLSRSVAGKTGSASADVDGSGSNENVDVFVVDSASATESTTTQSLRPRTRTTVDDATTFLSWQGDAESGDEGQCYLAWEHEGKAWFVLAECGASTAHVCSDDGTTASCAACDANGTCNECDEDKPLGECVAGGAAADDGASADDEAQP